MAGVERGGQVVGTCFRGRSDGWRCEVRGFGRMGHLLTWDRLKDKPICFLYLSDQNLSFYLKRLAFKI